MKDCTSFWQGSGSWQGNRFTRIGILSGIAKALFDYYWVMTSLPLAESQGENEAVLKSFYMSGQILLDMSVNGINGLSCDFLRSLLYSVSPDENNEENRSSCWQGSGNWRGYKFTTTAIGLGVAKAFFDNYWVMTSIPLAETQGENEALLKTFYMVGQILLAIPIYGMPGLSCDYLRSLFSVLCKNENNEERRLNT